MDFSLFSLLPFLPSGSEHTLYFLFVLIMALSSWYWRIRRALQMAGFLALLWVIMHFSK